MYEFFLLLQKITVNMAKKSGSKSRSVAIIAAAVVAVYIVGTLIALSFRCVKADTVILVPTGADYAALRDSLRTNNVGHSGSIDRIARVAGLTKKVHSGRYLLHKGDNAVQIVYKFRSAKQSPVKVTFNNIRTLTQLAGRVSALIEPDSVALVDYLTSPATAKKYGFTVEEFIGMFIPDTYEMWWNTSPEGFTDRMKRQYDLFWNANRRAEAEKAGLTVKQVATLASIVYEETKDEADMPVIAGVFVNRLRRGMKLQSCPTAKYAAGNFALQRVTSAQTRIDSPYNTYRYQGLPPGPICMPSIAAVEAVLNFTKHDYMFFCAKDDFSGRLYFSRTFAEHSVYAKRYAAALDRAGIK